jgi:hypothetical protein|uniref:Uncharacterized protein n=1 Tax=viral metagenome TaxID=1070528 RepID=A0A6C0AU94_9ZZZZ|tara:strand:- start:93 stop:428 length:336 start_codon:yes stop_codon:yes gene_type:complete
MEFNNDVWIEIKKYRFHRHLWGIPKYNRFNKVIKQLPKCGSSPSVFNYSKTPSVIVSTSSITDKFIKIYEYISWNTHKISLITFVCIPKSEDTDTFILNALKSLHYDVYVR